MADDDRTARALTALPNEEWTVFGAPRLPAGGCRGVDHVVVGPSGVFVIDSQRWTGAVHVRRDVLRRRGRLRKQALGGATRAALAVADVLDEPRQHLVKQATVLSEGERAALCADLALRFRAAAVAPRTRPPRGGGHGAVPADPSSLAGRLLRLLG